MIIQYGKDSGTGKTIYSCANKKKENLSPTIKKLTQSVSKA